MSYPLNSERLRQYYLCHLHRDTQHMQQISQASAAEVELRRNLVQFAPHLVLKLDELLQEERSRLRQQDYEMMYMQEECGPCSSAPFVASCIFVFAA